MRRLSLVALSLALASLTACGEPEPESDAGPRERVLLAAADLFHELTLPEDPFVAHRPATPFCHPLNGFYVEQHHLELNTANCDYFAVGQPALAAGARGDRVLGNVSHFDLTASEPSEAHLAITWGDVTLTEVHLVIPGPADVLDFELTLPRALGTSDVVTLHLHNHGQNTYQFGPFWLERAP